MPSLNQYLQTFQEVLHFFFLCNFIYVIWSWQFYGHAWQTLKSSLLLGLSTMCICSVTVSLFEVCGTFILIFKELATLPTATQQKTQDKINISHQESLK
jgi:hypothetical protein